MVPWLALVVMAVAQEPALVPSSTEPAPSSSEAPATEAPATEAPSTEAPATEAPSTSTPPADPPPSTSMPPADPPPSTPPPPPVAPPHDGLSPGMTAAAQIGAGAGVAAGASALRLGLAGAAVVLPALAPALGCAQSTVFAAQLCVVPAGVGYVETLVGDRVGQGRAAAVQPMIAGYGGCVAGGCVTSGIVTVAVALFVGLSVANPCFAAAASAAILGQPFASGSVFAFALALEAVNAVVVGAAPAIVYAASALPKEPGDTGAEWPRLTSTSTSLPASSTASSSSTSASSLTWTAHAMLF